VCDRRRIRRGFSRRRATGCQHGQQRNSESIGDASFPEVVLLQHWVLLCETGNCETANSETSCEKGNSSVGKGLVRLCASIALRLRRWPRPGSCERIR